MKIRVALILDPMGNDDEREGIVREFSDNGIDLEIAVEQQVVRDIDALDLDCVILDYGGMSLYGAHDTAKWNVKAAVDWARTHPSSLLIVWTYFTTEIYREVVDEFKPIENAVVRTSDEEDLIFDKIKQWLTARHKS